MDLDNEKIKKPMEVQNNLDFLHTQKIQTLNKNKHFLPEKRKRLQEIDLRLRHMMTMEQTTKLMFDYYHLENEKKDLEKEIDAIENDKFILDYFLQTGDILYEYYDNKNNVSEIPSPTTPSVSILDYLGESSLKTKISSKQTLLYKYLNLHGKDLINIDYYDKYEYNNDICSACHVEKCFFQQEALLICPDCGNTELLVIDSNKPSYKEPPREINFYSYKRINHFNEWLAQFQAKESTDIPDDVYNKLLIEIKKERIFNMASLSPLKMKEILKRLKLNKYYEHIPHIINNLNSIPAPIMTRETEETLRSMFKQIQAPFMKFCPNDRNNFLSYSYVLHKFCQLLNLDEFLVCFPLLKSREKLHKHDQIWKKICSELGWQFIKSI